MRLAASAVVTLFLLGLGAILAGPAFSLAALGRGGGLGAGALPQVVVVVVMVLACASLVSDLLEARRSPSPTRAELGPDLDGVDAGPPTATILLVGGGMLGLLIAYVALWRMVGFPIASVLFMAAASLLVAPREARRPAGLVLIAIVSAAFCIAVWLAFTQLLAVPLR